MVNLPKVPNKTIETLITLVSQHPDLYDDKSPNFRSTNKRARIWKEIATTLNRRGLNGETCKKLWETLRKSYLYFKKSASNPPSEKQKLFRKMTFLDNTNEVSGNQQPRNENRQQGNENQQPRNENRQQGNENQQQTNENRQQGNENQQPTNENRQQGNENQQQANKNNLGPENKDEKQGGVQKEGLITTPASAVLVSNTNSTQQYAIPSVQVNISGVDIHHGIMNRDVPNTPSAKPKIEFEPQSENVSMVDKLAILTTKVRTDMAILPREFQIKAQDEIFQVLIKYKSMAHIATGGIRSSLNTTM